MASTTADDGAKPSFRVSRLTVLGVHQDSDAYPNARYVVDLLKQSEALEVTEIRKTLFRKRPDFSPRKSLVSKLFALVRLSFRAAYSHSSIMIRKWIGRNDEIVYIPYPSVGVLSLYSLLPRALRPEKLVADGFISVYETAVIDRLLLDSGGLWARLLKALERRAYKTASKVIVDTEENRANFARLFDLAESQFVALPLATNEVDFTCSPYAAQEGQCHVFFMGTFVPLQGLDVIAGAIVALRDRQDIRITVLGYGQTAEQFETIVGPDMPQNLNWIKEWQDSDAIARLIGSADICLGIFAATPKAHRVWPLKNYAYMACGRSLISADTACARRMLQACSGKPFATVPAGDAKALTEMIVAMAGSPQTRAKMARDAHDYYEKYLANKVIRRKLIHELLLK